MVFYVAAESRRKGYEQFKNEEERIQQAISSAGLKPSDQALSLENRAMFWGVVNAISGLALVTSPFGSPVVGHYLLKMAEQVGYNNLLSDQNTVKVALAYTFCSMLCFGISKVLGQSYSTSYLAELGSIVSQAKDQKE